MPSEKSARASKRKEERNKPLRSTPKTHIARAQKAIAAKDVPSAVEAATRAQVTLDKAAQKGAIHPNNAARRKSRLMKKLSAAQVQVQVQAKAKPQAKAKAKPKTRRARPKAT